MDSLRNASTDLSILLQQYKVEEVLGWGRFFALDKVVQLAESLQSLLKKFGVKKLKLL